MEELYCVVSNISVSFQSQLVKNMKSVTVRENLYWRMTQSYLWGGYGPDHSFNTVYEIGIFHKSCLFCLVLEEYRQW